jgi:hypothetical protein
MPFPPVFPFVPYEPLTVREFCFQMYRLISASNPTVPLHGDDEKLAVRVLNQILQSYASSGLMLTIARTITVPVNNGIFNVVFTDPSYPTTRTQFETVTLTTGSPSFTVVNGAIYRVGETVQGNGIPFLTTILSIVGNLITLTANATITGTSNLRFIQDITPPDTVYVKQGRLANLDNAWLLLNGVTYPLIDKSRDDYLSAWKYDPLKGLPRFVITFPDTNLVTLRLYPAPSQFYEFFCRGKFQLPLLTVDDDLSLVPQYWHLYFMYAVAKYVSKFKGRGSAWTDDLEAEYRELKDNMESASEVNLSIMGDEQSLLNGAWRVRAGI